MSKNRNLIVPFLLFILFWGAACSTQKNTFVNRNFHSITTKYNGYFNARESYRDGLRRLDQMHEDNYEDVLSVFRYGSQQQASSVAGNMEVAYQKASTAIRRHSMNIKGIEYNRWIDDSYFLIARSHYFKGDYNLAILTFQYVIRQFDTPLKYHSKIWVAKSNIRAGNYNNALQILQLAGRNLEEGLLDESATLLYYKVYADLYLQQRDFTAAIPYLERASSLAKNRKLKTRLTYITAQSYQQAGDFGGAQQKYAQVLKMNPDFQMAFQARINMAMAFDTKSGDSNYILSELRGMLRDSKNREFRDQIYYALGQFSMRQNQERQAIEYYNLALDHYRDNRSQKGLTFLRLGEISFKNKNHIDAAVYYDSTIVYLSPAYPEFEAAQRKSLVLRELSSNLKRIEREDSLQRLASMNSEERNRKLDLIIEEIEQELELERQKEQERALLRQQMARQGRGQTTGEGDGGWYFYNPSAINFGKNEFYAKWGERRLEDLWRISNKRVVAFGEMEGFDEEEQQEQAGGRVTRASLLQDIPLTAEKKEQSDTRIAQGYYNAALIFKDRLNDPESAATYFERLVNRFPGNENRLLSAYFLYTIFDQKPDFSRATFYKDLIVREYPETDFARILSDPNYKENIVSRQNRIKRLYDNAYSAFLSGNYNYALELMKQAENDSLEISRDQSAQLSYLKALIYGRSDQKTAFIQQLTYVTQNYTETAVHEPANNLLAFLGSGYIAEAAMEDEINVVMNNEGHRTISTGTLPAESAIFSHNPDAVHFYVIVVNTRNVQVRELRNHVTTFNRQSYAESNLNLSTLFFDQNQQIVTITNFPNVMDANNYGKLVKEHLTANSQDMTAVKGFAISVDNYPLFYQERKLDEYLGFFKHFYPQAQ